MKDKDHDEADERYTTGMSPPEKVVVGATILILLVAAFRLLTHGG